VQEEEATMPEYLAPGVYVEETSFRSPSIQSVATSTTGFVGPCRAGPTDGDPVLVTSFTEFERVFGGLDDLRLATDTTNYLAYAARAFFDEGGRRLYVARVFGEPPAGQEHRSRTESLGGARFRARFAGSALDGAVTLRERHVPAGRATLDNAPTGTLVRTAAVLAGPAVLEGGTPPFRLAPDAVLQLLTGGATHEIRFEGTAAEETGGAIDPNNVDIPAATVLAVTVDGRRQEIPLTAGVTTLAAAVLELNAGLRHASARIGGAGSDQVIITSDSRGRDARLEVGELAALGFGAALPERSGSGNVGNLDAVTVDEIEALLARVTPPATERIPVRAVTAPGGTLRLETTTAVGGGVQLQAQGAARAALGLPAEARSGTAGSAGGHFLRGQDGSWTSDPASGAAFDPDAQGLVIVLLDLVFEDAARAPIASYEGLGLDPAHPAWLGQVLTATPARPDDELAHPYVFEPGAATGRALLDALMAGGVTAPDGRRARRLALSGGRDGAAPGTGDFERALGRLAEIEDIAILAAPGSSALGDDLSQAVRGQLITRAETSRFQIAVLDPEQGLGDAGIRTVRGRIDSDYAALYWPWVVIANPRARPGNARIPAEIPLPPSGHVAGIYARNDVLRGVHKAPANEVVRQALRFEREVPTGVQEVLNPLGINCLRHLTGRGYRVWGARLATSSREVVYVSDRRYLNYLKRSIYVSMQWAVFEPNGPRLWANIKDAVEGFLYTEWRNGALLGTAPEQAFFVRCDRTTMTQADLDNGRLVCEVGVALIKPAEFVIFRIGQKTADART
jgi:phage tail sheath protein FI